MQETRIPSSGLSKVGDYQTVGLSSRAGNGGIHLWLHKRLCAKVLWHKNFGTRVLATAVQFCSTDWLFVVVHAPHDRSPVSAHDTFLGHLEHALTSARKSSHRVLLLGDLNLRVRGMDPRVCGPYSMSDPVEGSRGRTENLIKLFWRQRLLLSNTWISSLDHTHYTWKHAKGPLAQLDYIAVAQKDFKLCMTCGVMSSAHFAMDHPSDHSLVVLRVRVHAEAGEKRQLDSGPMKFVNDDHLLACKFALSNSTPPVRTPGTSASEWWESTVTWITDVMKKTKPRK
eukprot:3092638-Amphidinium_carterae.1